MLSRDDEIRLEQLRQLVEKGQIGEDQLSPELPRQRIKELALLASGVQADVSDFFIQNHPELLEKWKFRARSEQPFLDAAIKNGQTFYEGRNSNLVKLREATVRNQGFLLFSFPFPDELNVYERYFESSHTLALTVVESMGLLDPNNLDMQKSLIRGLLMHPSIPFRYVNTFGVTNERSNKIHVTHSSEPYRATIEHTSSIRGSQAKLGVRNVSFFYVG